MSRTDDVFVIDVGDDENMTSVAWVAAMNELLDEVEAAEGPKALVTTSSAPKHFSNGSTRRGWRRPRAGMSLPTSIRASGWCTE